MTGRDEAQWLAQVRAFRPGGVAGPTPDCLDDDRLAALAEGTLNAEARSAALAHVAGCHWCRGTVASVARALADPLVAREARRAAAPAGGAGVRRWTPVAIALVAAAAVLVIALPSDIDEGVEPHRAAPITAAPAPEAVYPVGAVTQARRLRWTSVAGADRYRVTVFDASGSVRYEAELADTMVVLPDSAQPPPGQSHWWKVDARVGFDRWVASALIEFSVVAGERP